MEMTRQSPSSELISTARRPLAFQEAWILRVVSPSDGKSIWLRFSTLRSANGYRRTAEVLALISMRTATGTVESKFLRKTFDLSEFSPRVQVGSCILTDSDSHGQIHYKNHELSWNFSLKADSLPRFKPYPDLLSKIGMLQHSEVTEYPRLRCDGKVEIDGQSIVFTDAIAYKTRSSGTRNPDQWVEAHCNSLFDEKGQKTDALFEGVSSQSRFPFGISSPWISAFFILYQGKPYFFNDLWQSLRSRSDRSLNEWSFQIDRGDLSFRGQVSASHKDFIGMIFEDTNETLHHASFSQLADLSLLVYRRGKLESTLLSNGTATFEVVARERNPYLTATT